MENKTVLISAILLTIVLFSPSLADASSCDNYQRSDGKIVCLSEKTAGKLMERGWDLKLEIVFEPFIVPVEDKEPIPISPSKPTITESLEIITENLSKKEIKEIQTTDDSIAETQPTKNTQEQLPKYILNPTQIKNLIPQDLIYNYSPNMDPSNPDLFVQKIMIFFDDEIINTENKENQILYETQKGSLIINYNDSVSITQNTRFSYVIDEEQYVLDPKLMKQHVSGLLDELEITLNGDELIREGQRDPLTYYYKIFQQKDNLLVGSNNIQLTYTDEYSHFSFGTWNDNLDEMKLFDIEKATQNARSYLSNFEEASGSDCMVESRDDPYGPEMSILYERPIYQIGGNVCHIEYAAGHYNSFTVFVDAITGNPLFVRNNPTF